MLFEMLTLELPFLAPSPVALMLRILRERVPDPRSASHRTIPDALAELCMRATEPDPEARVASAAALGDAVTTFIDGVEEKRRRARMADELLETARVRMAEFEAEQAEISEARSVVDASLAGLASDAPFEARRLLWSAGQTLDARALEAEARFAEATRAASQALEYADLDEAHALLADQYWRRYVEASRTGQRAAAVFFADQVRAHDRGRYAARLASTSTLEITTEPPDATVTVQRQAPLGPLLEGRFADPPEVQVGSYVVLVESPGRAPVRRPVKVEPGRPTVVHVDAPSAFEGHEAYAYIPALVAAVGGDPDAHRGLPRAVVEVGPFFIGRHPVTVRE
jgi:hypothetical protein